MTKSLLSFVWVAGPLSGLIMQPVVGAWSDKCTSKYGRRRPFMIVGSVIVGLSLMLMAWTREFVDLFVSSEEWAPTVTIVFAVLSVFAADFSVNAAQACCRAIIVDSLPKAKQELANAWAGRMVAAGHLVGYYAGFINLINYFPFLGNNQLKILCAISSFALLLCVGITAWAVEERVLTITNEEASKISVYHILRSLLHTGFHLPVRIRQIFTVQLFAWYGWFTFLFYSSTWVGEIYVRYDADGLANSGDRVGDIGRVGSLALTMYSIVTLLCSLVLPLLVVPPNSDKHRLKSTYAHLPGPVVEFLHFIGPYRPTLPTAWVVGHIVYAIAMFSTIFVRTVRQATFIVGLCGFSWALASWAPFSLLAEEVRKLNLPAVSENGYQSVSVKDDDEIASAVQSVDVSAEEINNERLSETRSRNRPSPPVDPLSAAEAADVIESIPAQASSSSSSDIVETSSEVSDEEESSEQAGIYLGLHNVSITVPQFVSTFVSFIVFAILDNGKSDDLVGDGDEKPTGVNSIGVTLQLGAITALIAAYMTLKLRKNP
ncbi:uncharacterized protein V1518DRAFT_94921 [Limtongia smithiae]|uniref:uncharacterized protein n=1 Tax=Limtongia smithiae TaxID=1125753 RepID=UPI0034CE9197